MYKRQPFEPFSNASERKLNPAVKVVGENLIFAIEDTRTGGIGDDIYASIYAIKDIGVSVPDSPVSSLPASFELCQNFPNPFNPVTVIRYRLTTTEMVELTVFNELGQRVVELVDELQPAGESEVRWSGRDEAGNRLASGIYLYRLRAGAATQTRKLLLMR